MIVYFKKFLRRATCFEWYLEKAKLPTSRLHQLIADRRTPVYSPSIYQIPFFCVSLHTFLNSPSSFSPQISSPISSLFATCNTLETPSRASPNPVAKMTTSAS